ncbi:hypothetical protein M2454_002531 [Aequitasia blattaphilus]|uniref:ParB/Sulfiredoxin domain-containing protein n=1 Tax=Aequitasia blattaphilus TaxID=2949332 RepID=A0ABT1ECD4_9FIRM|nr:hypothetical protein [Aequitasia blattaphilus]MCP1103485.1 hypothetical protein [Aequitasia blattaphilus]MCR8616125.1 hypothetical protein [Aequitasia blattaphilus]
MSKCKYIEVHIDKLHPDVYNFRFDPVKDEAEALKTMVNRFPSKVYNLTKSILDNGGIDPSILPNIVPYEKGSSEYVVMEGNRRITALKIIKNISVISKTSHYKKFEKLLDKYDLTRIPDTYYCAMYEEKEDTYFWTYLRHAGELGGEGLVGWGALDIDRFRIGTKQAEPNISYYIVNYLRDNTQYQFDNLRFTTTLKRIVDSSVGKSYYGLGIVDEKLSFSNDVHETTEKICLLIDNLVNKSITSRNTNTVSDIQNWIDRLDEQYKSLHIMSGVDEEPKKEQSQRMAISQNSKSKESAKENRGEEAKAVNEKAEYQSGSTEEARSANKGNVRGKKLFEDLAYSHVDPNTCNGIIKLGNELIKLSKAASNGNYVTYPIATGMLLRAYIEQVFKYYLDKQGHWSILCSTRKNPNGDPALGEILVYCRNNRKVLFTDKTQLRIFGILFDRDSTIKDYLDLNIHHPNVVTITNIELNTFSNRGLSGFLNYLIR